MLTFPHNIGVTPIVSFGSHNLYRYYGVDNHDLGQYVIEWNYYIARVDLEIVRHRLILSIIQWLNFCDSEVLNHSIKCFCFYLFQVGMGW